MRSRRTPIPNPIPLPSSHHPPFHMILSRYLKVCTLSYTLLIASIIFYAIPFLYFKPPPTIIAIIFLILDAICTMRPYSRVPYHLVHRMLYTRPPTFNSFIHLLLHMYIISFTPHGLPPSPSLAISILVYLYVYRLSYEIKGSGT